MSNTSQRASVIQQLLDLHAVDQKILQAERELEERAKHLTVVDEGVADLEAGLERLNAELERASTDLRASERALDAKRDTMDRIRGRVNQSQNEKQYSAASLEFDLVKQDLRSLEDRVLEKMGVLEELEARKRELESQLEEARSAAGPEHEEMAKRKTVLEEEILIERDRRNNLAIRLEGNALGLYDRIRMGRSQVAMAPLTDESVCGHCYTAVTIQQEMQIKSMSSLICCEGCGVILYPGDLIG